MSGEPPRSEQGPRRRKLTVVKSHQRFAIKKFLIPSVARLNVASKNKTTMPRKHPPPPPPPSSDLETTTSSDQPDACYLIRVPKSINVKKLNHYEVDLSSFGLSDSVVSSKSDPERTSFGYSLLPAGATSATQLTLLRAEKGDDYDDQQTSLAVDSTFHLAGCINFYAYRTMPDSKPAPLQASCPNEPIEVIINRARGHSVPKRKRSQSPQKCTTTTTTIEMELNHYEVDLGAFGLSDSVVSSKSDPERISFGYSLLPAGAASAAQLTLLRGEKVDNDDDQKTLQTVDSTFHLAGCINCELCDGRL
ncbi:hypothetical protein TYRP_007057 [Tyrophagus putrescentiae]|nr:hypothetical protein TYRP_007057 [Tyrophagus putrescentiae]